MSITAGPLAAERAYVHTKSAIITGRLAGGQLVSESAIGAELGVSRTPVHEAFLRLDARISWSWRHARGQSSDR